MSEKWSRKERLIMDIGIKIEYIKGDLAMFNKELGINIRDLKKQIEKLEKII